MISRFVSSSLRFLLASAVVLVSFASMVAPAQAAAIVVTTLDDRIASGDGFCTLREAIANANANADTTGGDCAAGDGADIITFTVSGTITLDPTLGQFVILDADPNTLTIRGRAAITIAANSQSRIFLIGSTETNDTIARTLILEDITLAGGRALTAQPQTSLSGGAMTPNGGCILVRPNSTVTLNGAIVRDCSTITRGGGIYGDGNATINIRDTSRVIDNRADSGVGSGEGGGVYATTGVVRVDTNACVAQNLAATFGGGIYGDDDVVVFVGGGAESDRGFVINNEARTLGGGIFLDDNASFIGDHARFYSNIAPDGSAWYARGGSFGITPAGQGRICESCCIVNNSGIYAVIQPSNGEDTVWTGNWWGDNWGPLIRDLDPVVSGTVSSAISDGDGVLGDGLATVGVALIDAGDGTTAPVGGWLVSEFAPTRGFSSGALTTTAPADCARNFCTPVSGDGRARTCVVSVCPALRQPPY